MLWLRLLGYALTGQRVWVSTGGDGAWFARVLEAWPDHVVIAIASEKCSPDTSRMTLALQSIEYVREDWLDGARTMLDAMFYSEPPDGSDPKDPARVG